MSQCYLESNINSLIRSMAKALLLPTLTLLTTAIQKCQLFLNKGEGWDTCSCSSPILPVHACTAWKTTTQPSCGGRASPPSRPTEVLLYCIHQPMLQPPAEFQTPRSYGYRASSFVHHLGGQASGPATSIHATLRICDTSDWKILRS